MFTDKLEIGVKGFSISIPIELASTEADALTIAKQSSDYVVATFNRGHRINLQERTGARDYVRKAIAGKSPSMLKDAAFLAKLATEVQDVVAKWVPGARHQIVTAPPVLALKTEGKKSVSLEVLQAAAKAAGFTLVLE